MEPLPRGAQFVRSKMLWEIGLEVAGDPDIPYYGNRDLCITVGSGSGDSYKPWLRMAVGSPVLAKAVVAGDLEMAFVNPSGLLNQAYRGTGMFTEPLPVRVVANYPSWDRFLIMARPGAGITSLAQLKAEQRAVRCSIREDSTHSTRVLIDQLLALYDFSLKDIESWGGTFQLNGPPMDPRRYAALEQNSVDLVFDEGIKGWLPRAIAAGYRTLSIDEPALGALEALGWRKAVVPEDRFPGLGGDHVCIDYSGWPLYTRASLPDEAAYKVCAAIKAREAEIPWEEGAYTGLDQLGRDTEATPLDVPLHPGAAQWYREQGYIK